MTADPFDIKPGDIVNGTAVKIGAFAAGSDEWHAARANGIGGSEIGAIVGLSPFDSKFSCYYRKKMRLKDIEITAPIEWGTRLEAAVFEKYAESLEPGEVITTGDTFHHVDYPFMIANPDGIVWRKIGAEWKPVRILEIKTSSRGDGYGPDGSDQVPPSYLCQITWYSKVLSVPKVQLAALISGVDYRVFNPTVTEDDAQFLIEAGQQFMHDLEHNIEPDLTKDTATYDAVRQINPHLDPDEEVEVPKDVADRYVSAVDAFNAAKTEKVAMDAEILHGAGTARLIKCGDEVIARRQMPGGSVQGVPYLRRVEPKKLNETSVLKAVANS